MDLTFRQQREDRPRHNKKSIGEDRMGVYIGNAASILAAGWIAHRYEDKKWVSCLYLFGIWCIWTLLGGLRTGIGTDYNHYYNLFYEAGATTARIGRSTTVSPLWATPCPATMWRW